MKPDDFDLNSDYLTLANVDNYAETITVPAVTVPAGGKYKFNYDITAKKPIKATFVRMCVHHNKWSDSTIWGVGGFGSTAWMDNGHRIVETMNSYSLSDNKIRFTSTISLDPASSSNVTVPAHTIKVRISRFKIPNVF